MNSRFVNGKLVNWTREMIPKTGRNTSDEWDKTGRFDLRYNQQRESTTDYGFSLNRVKLNGALTQMRKLPILFPFSERKANELRCGRPPKRTGHELGMISKLAY